MHPDVVITVAYGGPVALAGLVAVLVVLRRRRARADMEGG
jgi:uncharacterized protein (TIGR03382 family)